MNPDFAAYARSFGCYGRRVLTLDGFEPALADALQAGRPAVLEIAFPVPPPPRDYGAGQRVGRQQLFECDRVIIRRM